MTGWSRASAGPQVQARGAEPGAGLRVRSQGRGRGAATRGGAEGGRLSKDETEEGLTGRLLFACKTQSQRRMTAQRSQQQRGGDTGRKAGLRGRRGAGGWA